MDHDETTSALLRVVDDFATTHVASMARRVECDSNALHAIMARADELGLHELAHDGLYHSPCCDAQTLIQLIGRIGECDVSIALHLFSTMGHGALQRHLMHQLAPVPIIPYAHCGFVMVPAPAETEMYAIHTQSNGYALVRTDRTTMTTRQYMGLRGVTWLIPTPLPTGTIVEDIAPLAYNQFLQEMSLLYQCLTLSLLRATIRYAHAYANTRHTFGRAIVRWQAISQKLARMAIAYEQAATCFDTAVQRPETSGTVRQSQHLLCAVLDEIVEGAVQTLGGHGYLVDHPVEKWMRDGQVLKVLLRELGTIQPCCGHTS